MRQPASRRFPPPWTVEELDACFVVRDRGELQLAFERQRYSPDTDQKPYVVCGKCCP
jgi:hypothetical protein